MFFEYMNPYSQLFCFVFKIYFLYLCDINQIVVKAHTAIKELNSFNKGVTFNNWV